MFEDGVMRRVARDHEARGGALARVLRLLLDLVVTLIAAATLLAAPAETKAKPRKGMELPPELQTGTTEAKLTFRKIFVLPNTPVAEMLRFDPYRVVDFRRGWTKGTGSGSPHIFAGGWTFQWTTDSRTLEYSFDMIAADDRRWTCSCAAASTSKGAFFDSARMGIGIAGHGEAHLSCLLQAPDDPVEWRFEVGVDLEPGLLPTKTAKGWARHGSDEIALTATERLARWGRQPGRLVGWVLAINDRPVAAVDLANKGAVIFGAELPPALRDPVAAVGAAALLFPDQLDPFPG